MICLTAGQASYTHTSTFCMERQHPTRDSLFHGVPDLRIFPMVAPLTKGPYITNAVRGEGIARASLRVHRRPVAFPQSRRLRRAQTHLGVQAWDGLH